MIDSRSGGNATNYNVYSSAIIRLVAQLMESQTDTNYISEGFDDNLRASVHRAIIGY